MTERERAERMQILEQGWRAGPGSGQGGQVGAGGGRKKQAKKRGMGNERRKGVVPNFRTAGRRIRWRVPELTPNTPRPAASTDKEIIFFPIDTYL